MRGDLQHVMERVGRIVAADQLLKVEVRGTRAYATPGRVVIPAIERYEWLGKDAALMLHGLLDHECGHASFTNFDLVKEIRTKHPEPLGALWNQLEDAMIERMKGEEYRGCMQNLERLNQWWWDLGDEGDEPVHQRIAEYEDVWSAFLMAVFYVSAQYGGQTIETVEKLRPIVGAMLRLVEDDIAEIATCTTTEEIWAITQRVYETLRTAGKTGKSEKVLPKALLAVLEKLGAELPRWTKDPMVALNPTDAVNLEIEKMFEDPDRIPPYIVFSHEFDLERNFGLEEHSFRGRAWEQDWQKARKAAESLTIAFETALHAKRDLRAMGGFDEGTPDPNLLGEYAVGACPADQLYQQFVAEDSDDVAVAIQLDCSGSMAHEKATLAKLTAMALHQALSACQLAHEITGFTTQEDAYPNPWLADGEWRQRAQENRTALIAALEEARAQGTDIYQFARCVREWAAEGGDYYQVPVYSVFKDFSSNDARGLQHVAGINHNLDGEAVLWQARRLAARPEVRRVMFVLSDGWPEGSKDNASGAEYLKQAVRRVTDAGIEVYGIGMMSAAVREFYPKSWVCNDMHDLSRLALTAMIDVLLRSRQERRWVRVA